MNYSKSLKFGTYARLIGLIAILFTGYGIFNTYQINKHNEKNNNELIKLFSLIEGSSKLVISSDSAGIQRVDRLQAISPQNVNAIKEVLIEQSVSKISEYSKNLADSANRNSNTLILWAGVLTLFSIIFTFWGLTEIKDKLNHVEDVLAKAENKVTKQDIKTDDSEENITNEKAKDQKDGIDNIILLKIKEEVKLAFYEKEIQAISDSDINSSDTLKKADNLIAKIEDDILNQNIKNSLLYKVYLFEGNHYYNTEQYNKAIEYYSKTLDSGAGSKDIYLNIGNAYHFTQDKVSAIDNYQKAIEIDTENKELYFRRGMIYSDLGDKDAALNDFAKAIDIDVNYIEAYFYMADVYLSLSKYEYALDNYNKIIELNPSYTAAYFNRGNIYYRTGESELAKKDYTKVIELAPNYKEAFYNRGKIYMQTGLFNLAVDDYTKAIKLDPEYKKAYNNRGNIYAQLNINSLAVSDFSKVIELDPSYKKAYIGRGIVFARENDIEQALHDLNKAKEINEDSDLELKNSIDIIIEKLEIQRSQNMRIISDEDCLEE